MIVEESKARPMQGENSFQDIELDQLWKVGLHIATIKKEMCEVENKT